VAQKVQTVLISDLTGDEIKNGGESIDFAYKGVSYSIDLTDKEAAGFDKAIGMYLEHAQRTGGRVSRSRGSSSLTRSYDPKAVKAWAAANNIDVPARGRIPGAILEQYRAAGN